MAQGGPSGTSGCDRAGGEWAAAQGHTGSSVPPQLRLPGHFSSPARLPQGPSQIPGASATAPSRKEALTHPSSEGRWRTFCIPEPPPESGAQSWEKAQRLQGGRWDGTAFSDTLGTQGHDPTWGAWAGMEAQNPGLRPPLPPQPSIRQTTASALRDRKHSILKTSSGRAGRGRAGQGWPPHQCVQRPLQPPGSTQQSEAPPSC